MRSTMDCRGADFCATHVGECPRFRRRTPSAVPREPFDLHGGLVHRRRPLLDQCSDVRMVALGKIELHLPR